MWIIAGLTTAAFATATVSGMIGLGGGTMLVAILYAVLGAPAIVVPIHAAVQLLSNGSRVVAYVRHVDFRSLGWFMVGAIPAPFLVVPLITDVDEHWAKLFMGSFIIIITWTRWLRITRLTGSAGLVFAGVLAGGLGMVVGATGTLIAPFFLRDDWRKETVIGTKALCQACAHIIKLSAFAAHGLWATNQWDLIVPMGIAVVIGTFSGKKLVGYLKETTFRLVFRILLTILALKLMILSSFHLELSAIGL